MHYISINKRNCAEKSRSSPCCSANMSFLFIFQWSEVHQTDWKLYISKTCYVKWHSIERSATTLTCVRSRISVAVVISKPQRIMYVRGKKSQRYILGIPYRIARLGACKRRMLTFLHYLQFWRVASISYCTFDTHLANSNTISAHIHSHWIA